MISLADTPAIFKPKPTFCHRQVWKQRISLKHHANIALIGPQVRHILPVDLDRANGRRLKPRHHPQNRGFPAARRAQKRNKLALRHAKIKRFHHLVRAKGFLQRGKVQISHQRGILVCLENLVANWISIMQAQVKAKVITAKAAGS